MKEQAPSKRWIEQGNRFLMGNYARFPLVLRKGRGAYVWDVDGRRYLDFVSGIAVNLFGHGDTEWVKTVRKQAGKLVHVSNLYYHPTQIELARLLVEHSFADKVFFCNSGVEANEAAIKLTRKYAKAQRGPNCYEVITMQGAFHGRTFGMMTATGQEKYHKGFEPLLPGFKQVPFDDPDAIERAVTPQTAGVFLEPIQGEGGVRIPQKGFLTEVRKICDRHRLLLVLDEVQTGIGRTGRLFAYEHEGIQPDIITLAKGLGGGVPIGAMLARDEVAALFTPGSHAATFGGNPLVCAAGTVVLKRLTKNALFLEAVRLQGAYLMDRLMQLQKTIPLIKAVRGMGLIVAVDITQPIAASIVTKAMEQGLLLNRTSDETLRFIPPLVIKKIEIDKMISILTDILRCKNVI